MLNDIYLIRHGHPQQNTGIAYDRVPGPPLSETGREEARIAGLFLAHLNVQRIYSSPLERAQQTAELVGVALGVLPLIAPALAEHRNDEGFDAVRERTRLFMAQLESEDNLSSVALVAHGSPIKALLLNLSNDQINLTEHRYSNGNHVPTAGIWHARREKDVWQLDLIFKPIVTAPVGHVAV